MKNFSAYSISSVKCLSLIHISLETVDSQANLHITETPEDFYKVEMDFQISENTRMFGIRLFEDPETGDSYKYEVNLAENRIYFDRTPNQPWYRYFDKGLERPIHLEAGRKYHARLDVYKRQQV